MVLGAIFLLPVIGFAAFLLTLAAIGAVEWMRLARLAGTASRVAVLAVFAALIVTFTLPGAAVNPASVLIAAACASWVLAAVIVVRFPRGAGLLHVPWANALWGALLLTSAWYSLVVLRAGYGPWLVLWLLAVVWSADIGGYVAGRTLGRRKLAPAVSPAKTWEGAWGGLVGSALVGGALAALVPALASRASLLSWCVAGVALGLVSIFGDLFESVLKRVAGVKDSGTLFPGHGGVLDRIDSVIAAAPFLALVLGGFRPAPG